MPSDEITFAEFKNLHLGDEKDLALARALLQKASAKEINRAHKKYPAKVEYLMHMVHYADFCRKKEVTP